MQVRTTDAKVYSRPDAASAELGTVPSGHIVFVTRTENGWAGISPPDNVGVWINRDFVEGSRVIAKSIQVRSGPGLEHDIVGTLQRGAPVMELASEGDWCKISPPSSMTVWVREDRLQEIAAKTEPIREVALPPPEPAPVPAPAPEPVPAPAPVAKPTPSPAPAPAPSPQPQPPVPAPKPREPVKVSPSTPQPTKPVQQPVPAPKPHPVTPPPRPVVHAPAPVAPYRPVAKTPVPYPQPVAPSQPRPAAAPAPVQPSRPATLPALAPAPVGAPFAIHDVDAMPSYPVDQALVDDLNLRDDAPYQGHPRRVTGQLRNAPLAKATPSRYRLLVRKGDTVFTLCYVHGDADQLRPFTGKNVVIQGREYWVDEDAKVPVVVVGGIAPRLPSGTE